MTNPEKNTFITFLHHIAYTCANFYQIGKTKLLFVFISRELNYLALFSHEVLRIKTILLFGN